MLKTRVIPTLLVRRKQAFKGEAFASWRPIGSALAAVEVHNHRQVDELIILDIDAHARRGPDYDAVGELAEAAMMPLTVGGGVTSLDQIRGLLNAGADKVAIGRAGRDLDFLSRAASKFGRQSIVASVDHRDGWAVWQDGEDSMTTVMLAEHLVWVDKVVGEILLTSIEREGTMRGYDLLTLAWAAHHCYSPIVAHGGAGSYQDMVDALDVGVHAVAAGAMFQFTDATPKGAARYIAERGYPTRC